ncbi:MAG: alpha/beta hydrolase [Verrucomicrobiales bacterium]|nr:alpha/beta hydrolase [Verrucomicrobiales bacterium]
MFHLVGVRAVLSHDPAQSASAPPRLPRDRLLLYRNRSGKLREATSRAQWLRRRADIILGFEKIAGPLPGRERRCPLDLQVEDEFDAGTYVRRAVSYQAEPGGRVPAYLLIPKSGLAGKKCPAALCLHQTHAAGRKVVVGLGNSPDDEYGVELARRGFVCLAPPYPLLADYNPDLFRLGYASGTMKAIWDNIRGLDLLESLPFVRREAVVAIGHSLGGHNAIFTAVMEPRIKVVVTSCAFDSFVDYMGGNISGWNQVRYMPRLKDYIGRPADIPFDFHELVGALAPRGLFVNAPTGDSNFRWQSVDRIASAAQPVYALYHAEKHLVVRHPECQHRFPPELRQEAYTFMDAQLAALR